VDLSSQKLLDVLLPVVVDNKDGGFVVSKSSFNKRIARWYGRLTWVAEWWAET